MWTRRSLILSVQSLCNLWQLATCTNQIPDTCVVVWAVLGSGDCYHRVLWGVLRPVGCAGPCGVCWTVITGSCGVCWVDPMPSCSCTQLLHWSNPTHLVPDASYLSSPFRPQTSYGFAPSDYPPLLTPSHQFLNGAASHY